MPLQGFVIARGVGAEKAAAERKPRIQLLRLDQHLQIIEALVALADQAREEHGIDPLIAPLTTSFWPLDTIPPERVEAPPRSGHRR